MKSKSYPCGHVTEDDRKKGAFGLDIKWSADNHHDALGVPADRAEYLIEVAKEALKSTCNTSRAFAIYSDHCTNNNEVVFGVMVITRLEMEMVKERTDELLHPLKELFSLFDSVKAKGEKTRREFADLQSKTAQPKSPFADRTVKDDMKIVINEGANLLESLSITPERLAQLERTAHNAFSVAKTTTHAAALASVEAKNPNELYYLVRWIYDEFHTGGNEEESTSDLPPFLQKLFSVGREKN